MQDLLPFYERELAFLRKQSQVFAARYPKIAARLTLSQDGSEDPHVERLIQSFALLSARISKKLDDDYPEFTEALLDALYPQYLKPFPSCSIAHFGLPAGASPSQAALVPRHTELLSHAVRGVPCRFRTAYDVMVSPMKVTAARYQPLATGGLNIVLPRQATSCLSLTIGAGEGGWSGLKQDSLRVFVDAETSLASLLMDALLGHVCASYLESEASGRWTELELLPLQPVGFDEDELLVPQAGATHPALGLLAEHFAFPEKFQFFDIDIAMLRRCLPGGKTVTLHLVFRDLRAGTHASQMLEETAAQHFQTGCSPVVNLFERLGDPIRLTHASSSYPVVADGRNAAAYEVYSIDSVKLVRQTEHGDTVVSFQPFYSLKHGQTPQRNAHYWVMRRNAEAVERSPGYEAEISVIDADFNPLVTQSETLSLALTCTNRDLPTLLSFGQSGGDLFVEGNSQASRIRLLRRPSATLRPRRGKSMHWRLVSHLALSHQSLVDGDAAALRELLYLYDWRCSSVSSQQIESIVGIAHQQSMQWLPGQPFATFVRGVEVRLRLDDARFVGSSLQVFVAVLDRFFGLYVNLNSFTQLVVLSAQQEEKELARCKPRSGASTLL